jgi:hypothetical protein
MTPCVPPHNKVYLTFPMTFHFHLLFYYTFYLSSKVVGYSDTTCGTNLPDSDYINNFGHSLAPKCDAPQERYCEKGQSNGNRHILICCKAYNDDSNIAFTVHSDPNKQDRAANLWDEITQQVVKLTSRWSSDTGKIWQQLKYRSGLMICTQFVFTSHLYLV